MKEVNKELLKDLSEKTTELFDVNKANEKLSKDSALLKVSFSNLMSGLNLVKGELKNEKAVNKDLRN